MSSEPFSYRQYPGNGATVDFSVPFPYLLKAHVKVYIGYSLLDGSFSSELFDGSGFTWTSGTQIQLAAAPTAGQTVTVIRQTPTETQVVGWQDGSNLIADDLDAADKQNLYVVQEQTDRSNLAIATANEAVTELNDLTTYGENYLGALAADPAAKPNGGVIQEGNFYYNTATKRFRVFGDGLWSDGAAPTTLFRWKKVAAGGETTLSGADDNGQALAYTADFEQVYVNGSLLVRGVDYVAINGADITGLTALTAGDVVEVISFNAFTIGVAPTEVDFTGLAAANQPIADSDLFLLRQGTSNKKVTAAVFRTELAADAQAAQAAAETAQAAAETAKAGAETAQAGAETAKAGAELAQANAESARDDALLNSGVFPSVAAGLAATAVGGYFKTFSGNTNDFLELYRVDSGPVATLVSAYPSRSFFSYFESSLGYDDFYLAAWLDTSNRLSMGIRPDGGVRIEKADVGSLSASTITAQGGSINLDSIDIQLLNILQGGAQTADASYADVFSHVVVDASDRVAYGVRPDGSVEFRKPIALGSENIGPDSSYDSYAYVEADSAGRISRLIKLSGEQYFPKAEIDQLTVKSFSISGSTTGLRSDSVTGGLLGLFESRTDGSNHQVYRYYKGIESQLTAQGDNFGISLTDEDPKRVLFYTTRNDALNTGASEPYVMDADGGRQVPALGTSDITLWGDSMAGTFGVSTTQQSFIDAGETDYTRAFRNQGSGGLSSVVIAMQMGAAGWTVEVPGGQINASGNTIVTNNRAAIYTDFATEKGLNLDPFAYSSFPAKMPRQRVAGVIGKIQQQSATTVTTTATGSAGGSTVTVANATGIEVGMLVKQTNGNEDKIILGTTVTAISGTTITLSASNVSALSSDSLDFYYEGGYVFARETAGDVVPVSGPQEVVPITNIGFGTDQSYPQTDMKDLLNSIQILWPFGPHGSGGDDPATMEMIVLDAMLKKGLTALDKKYVMLNAVASSTLAVGYANLNGTFTRSTDSIEQAYFDNYGDRYLSIINTALNGDADLGIADFKTWFSTKYPTVYTSDPDYGWQVPGISNVYRQTTTSGVTGVNLVGNGGSGAVSATSVDTTTSGNGVGLRLGVVASGGVATAIWVREPGMGYAVSDTVTIPVGAIGNSAAITATVSSIGTSAPGNDVFNQDGSIDTANAYNQWDEDNGWMPRAMIGDTVHLTTYGAEYVRLMVAKFILNQNW